LQQQQQQQQKQQQQPSKEHQIVDCGACTSRCG
jgi:hypothetical protein